MAGRGPAPKDPSERVRRNVTEPATVVTDDGELRGPELPEMDDDPWHPRTLAWWETWRRSPQAQRFVATDWDFLIDTALMHHTMWSKNKWEFAAELRLRAAKFGATPEDRARLKIEIDSPGAARKPATRARSTTNRRDRILNAVDSA